MHFRYCVLARFPSAFSTSLLLLAAACGSPAGSDTTTPAGASAEEVVVKPVGGDHPGSLLVTLPANAPNGLFAYTLWVSKMTAGVASMPSPIGINQPNKLASGTYCLTLVTTEYNSTATVSDKFQDCTIQVSPKQTTTYPLSVVTFKKGATVTLGVDPVDAFTSTMILSSLKGGDGKTTTFGDSYGINAVRPAGNYHYAFGLFDGVDGKVAAGAVQAVDVSSLAQRRSLVVTASVPTFPSYNGNQTAQLVVKAVKGAAFAQVGFHVPYGTGAVLVGEYDDHTPVGTYTLELNGDYLEVALSATAGAASTAFAVQRIDVDDVAVDRDDGSTVATSGTYAIDRVMTGAGGATVYKNIVQRAPTKTGVDVFPGSYRITTTYRTTEAGFQNSVDTVTVP